MRCLAQRHSARCNHLLNRSRVLLAQYVCHTLVVVDGRAGMQLEHLLAERRVGHHVPTDVPRDNIRIHGLHIAFTRLVIDGVVGQCILGHRGT